MIEALPKIAEYLAALFMRKEKRRSEFFNIQVEPLFQMLTKVHEDYILGIREVRNALKRKGMTPAKLRELTKDKRTELAHMRKLVRDHADFLGRRDFLAYHRALREKALAKIPKEQRLRFQYADSVLQYFNVSFGDQSGSAYTALLDALNHFHQGRTSKERLAADIGRMFVTLDRRWGRVSNAYVDLKDFLTVR